MNRKLHPIKLKATTGKSAWMYVDAQSLEVFIHYAEEKNPVSAKITLAQLKKIL